MAHIIKLLVQTGMAATSAFGRAFKQAVDNEMRHGRASTSANDTSGGSGATSKTQTKSNYVHGMTLSEAVQILDVTPELTPTDVERRYRHLFDINEKAKGGSFYVQSKVYRARERIAAELERQGVNLDEIVGPAVPVVETPPPASDDASTTSKTTATAPPPPPRDASNQASPPP